MKIESLLLAALCAAPGLGRAAAISPLAAMNKSIAEMMVAFDKTQQCFELMNSLRADYARKKAELYSEFKGAIPIAFDDLLAQKAARINKQHKACVQQYDALGLQLESLMMTFRTIEPKSLNIQKQRETVLAQKEKYRQMRPAAKPPSNSPQPLPKK